MDVARQTQRWLEGPHRGAIVTGIATGLALAGVGILVRAGWLVAATGLVGVTGMAVACVLGLAAIRGLLSGSTGIAGVARAVIDDQRRRGSPVLRLHLTDRLAGLVTLARAVTSTQTSTEP